MFATATVRSQDGSDIRYVKVGELKTSDIGKIIQIDFFKRSFAPFDGKRIIDKVTLNVGEKKIEFIENRSDDGFNNWFRQQFLESSDAKTRISDFRLDKIDDDKIIVTANLNTPPFIQRMTVKKADVAEILVRVQN